MNQIRIYRSDSSNPPLQKSLVALHPLLYYLPGLHHE
jgi:hypothetical protein